MRPQALLGGLLQKMGGGSPASTAAAKEEASARNCCLPVTLLTPFAMYSRYRKSLPLALP